MTEETLLLGILAVVTIIFAAGMLFVRDNFFAAMYMSATLIMVATISAFFGIEPAFVLIVFIFVGAIGVVTVALASTYREHSENGNSLKMWLIPAIVTAGVIAISVYTTLGRVPVGRTIAFELASFLSNPEYILLVISLTALGILLMLSVLKMIGGADECH